MAGDEWLAGRFEENRGHLRAVAFRMLGSKQEAEDAVQEAWLRLSRSETGAIDNLGGWLTTVVGRICLDMLRVRRARPEHVVGEHSPTLVDHAVPDPQLEAVQADSVGLALLVVLETLAPAERLAFVLHDMFAVPFDEIASIVGRSPAAARQLASRARRRVQGEPVVPEADSARQHEIVAAFLTASRTGDFEALLTMLDPDVVLRADDAAAAKGAVALVRGANAIAQTFSGRAKAAKLALVDGIAGAVWVRDGEPQVVIAFTVTDGVISTIELLADADFLADVELTMLEN